MGMKRIMVLLLKCLRCGHEWQTRKTTKPKVCSRCKSAVWNKPRVKK